MQVVNLFETRTVHIPARALHTGTATSALRLINTTSYPCIIYVHVCVLVRACLKPQDSNVSTASPAGAQGALVLRNRDRPLSCTTYTGYCDSCVRIHRTRWH